MVYGAAVWHSPKGTQPKGLGPATKLNTCLRSTTGAYKATSTKVLLAEAEAEAGVLLLDIYLDQSVLRARDAPRCQEVMISAKSEIHRRLKGKRGRRSQPGDTPMSVKDAWAKKNVEEIQNNWSRALQQEG